MASICHHIFHWCLHTRYEAFQANGYPCAAALGRAAVLAPLLSHRTAPCRRRTPAHTSPASTLRPQDRACRRHHNGRDRAADPRSFLYFRPSNNTDCWAQRGSSEYSPSGSPQPTLLIEQHYCVINLDRMRNHCEFSNELRK